jgi:hypothetical protein
LNLTLLNIKFKGTGITTGLNGISPDGFERLGVEGLAIGNGLAGLAGYVLIGEGLIGEGLIGDGLIGNGLIGLGIGFLLLGALDG